MDGRRRGRGDARLCVQAVHVCDAVCGEVGAGRNGAAACARHARRQPQAQERRPSASSIFLSVLYWLSAYTDQIAAGNQPISVI
ncbi:hypothetical protein CO709_00005 [Burkholderia thailandensis]|nr:hypothetical protein CO709_00005 [Burkholderia thailandensis]